MRWLILGLFFLPLSSFNVSADSMYRIGVLYWSMDIPGQVVMREGLEAAVDEFNHNAISHGERQVNIIPYVAGNGDEGIERQISQMYELIDKQVDLIIVQPTDNAALSKPLIKANQLKIPVNCTHLSLPIIIKQVILAGNILLQNLGRMKSLKLY